MKRLLYLLLFLAPGPWPLAPALNAQGTSCGQKGTFTSATNGATLDNRLNLTAGCVAWRLTYFSTGLSALSISVQGAPDSNGTAGTFADIASGFVTQGSNPSTGLQSEVYIQAFFPWIRVHVQTFTTTGSITYNLNGVNASVAMSRSSSSSVGVSSYNARTGTVLPASGDYTAALVTNAFDTTADNALGAHSQDSTEIATPASPAASHVKFYAKAGKLCSVSSAGVETCTQAAPGTTFYQTVMDEASGLTQRVTINFTGSGVTCADDAGNSRTNCTIPGDAVTSVFGQTGAVVTPITSTDVATPSNPAASNTKVYTKSGVVCSLSPAGLEYCTGPAGGGGNAITTGTFASLPASSPAAGDTYFFTDSLYEKAIWSGSVWLYYFRGHQLAIPTFSGFSWTNQGNATLTTSNGANFFSSTASTTGVSVYTKSSGAAPWTFTALFVPNWTLLTAGQGFGLTFRQSSDGKLANCWISSDVGSNTGFMFNSQKWTNATTFSANYTITGTRFPDQIWLRVADDNTNRICSYSYDGTNFTTFHTVGRTDFLTADQYGINVQNTTSVFGGFAVLQAQ